MGNFHGRHRHNSSGFFNQSQNQPLPQPCSNAGLAGAIGTGAALGAGVGGVLGGGPVAAGGAVIGAGVSSALYVGTCKPNLSHKP